MTTSTPTPLRIVPGREDDLELVQRLADTIWREHYVPMVGIAQVEYMLARGYTTPTLRKFVRDEGAGLAILRTGDEPVGFAAWYRPGEPATTKLDKLYVHASQRGRGGGRMLIEHVEDAARRDGSRTVILNVYKGNAKSIAAYRACGYAPRESVVIDIGGGFVMDDYIMAKTL